VKRIKNLNDIFEQVESIIKKFKENNKICIVHHDDSDGCTSCALLYIIIYNLTGNYPDIIPIRGPNDIKKGLISKLKTLNYDYVIFLDVTADPKKLDSLKGFVLDHHIFKDIEEREEMRYFNPCEFEKDDEKVVPTSYMCYKILIDLFPDEKVAWIAGIGITEDHRVDICKEVFEKIKKENPEILKLKKINQENIEKSFFGELGDMVRSGRMIKGSDGAKNAVLAMVECKNRPDKFINGLTQHSSALRNFYEKVKYRTEGVLDEIEKTGEFYKKEKVIFYESPKTQIKSATSFFSDKIRQKYPGWIVCVTNKDKKNAQIKISIRLEQTVRKVDLVSILENIKKKIDSLKGGGHRSAVGAFVNIDDYEDFKKEFLNEVKKLGV